MGPDIAKAAGGLSPDESEDLALLAASRLQQRDFRLAFRLVDRLCRLRNSSDARFLMLRGEALRGLGRVEAAEREFRKAFDLDPTDPLINRRLLMAEDDTTRIAAARRLCASARSDRRIIAEAIEVLLDTGFDVIGSLHWESGRLFGWLAWRRSGEIRLHCESADYGRAGVGRCVWSSAYDGSALPSTIVRDFSISVAAPNAIRVTFDDRPCRETIALRVNTPTKPIATTSNKAIHSAPFPRCTVIVPVYDDIDITTRCLSSLGRQITDTGTFRTIIIDDRPDHPEIGKLARRMADRFQFELLINDQNLGFIGSVNRALAEAPDDDILLLNSDVVMPMGTLRRLREVAHSRPEIGTVTPLSNNGEVASFPIPFVPNPLPSFASIDAVSRVAAEVNAGRVVRIPNGIGFCLYIKRACLARIGQLPTVYLSGYYEDVEICLRAEELGFENVCATNIFVGHKGSSSFKTDKQALVVRNLNVLRSRFPQIDMTSSGFAIADPLREARAAIEMRMAVDRRCEILLVTEDPRADSPMDAPPSTREVGVGVLVLSRRAIDGAMMMHLRALDGGMPQSLVFPATEAGVSDLFAYLEKHALRRVEIADVSLDPLLLQGFRERGLDLAMLFEDFPIKDLRLPVPASCHEMDGTGPCGSCTASFVKALQHRQATGVTTIRARTLLAAGITFSPLNTMAARFARKYKLASSETPTTTPIVSCDKERRGMTHVLGVLHPEPNAAAERLVMHVGRRLARSNPEFGIVILGKTLNDARFLGMENVFVTGPVRNSEYEDVIENYQLSALLLADRWKGFGHLERVAGTLPICYFDWSFQCEAKAGDRALDSRVCDTKATSLIVDWCLSAFAERPLDVVG